MKKLNLFTKLKPVVYSGTLILSLVLFGGSAWAGAGGEGEGDCEKDFNACTTWAYDTFKHIRGLNQEIYEECIANPLNPKEMCKEGRRASNLANRALFGEALENCRKEYEACKSGGEGDKDNKAPAMRVTEGGNIGQEGKGGPGNTGGLGNCEKDFNACTTWAYDTFKYIRGLNQEIYEDCIANPLNPEETCKEGRRASNMANRALFGEALENCRKEYEACKSGGEGDNDNPNNIGQEGKGGPGDTGGLGNCEEDFNKCTTSAYDFFKHIRGLNQEIYEACIANPLNPQETCKKERRASNLANRALFGEALENCRKEYEACKSGGEGDNDNASDYFKINTTPKVDVYPNPSYNGEVYLNFGEEDVTSVSVMNMQGQVLETLNVAGATSTKLNVETTGVYSILMNTTNGNQITKRVVIQ